VNLAKKIANRDFEEVAGATTRTTNRSGLSKQMRREKRIRNRTARRREAAIHWADQE
jgi:hypothetical protein